MRTYEDIDDDSCAEFSVATDQVTSIVCWYTTDQVSVSSCKIKLRTNFIYQEIFKIKKNINENDEENDIFETS